MTLFGANLLLFALLFENTYRYVFYTLGRCTNLMKVRGDDHLGGARSLSRFLRQISSFSGDIMKTLSEMGSIHWVGVQTWLQSSHARKR